MRSGFGRSRCGVMAHGEDGASCQHMVGRRRWTSSWSLVGVLTLLQQGLERHGGGCSLPLCLSEMRELLCGDKYG